MAYMYMPGATAVGITYDGGVVMASERRIAYGNFVVSKNTKKTFKITDYVGACCAGMVADMQVLAMQMRAMTKIRKMELKREIPPNSVAKMMSSLMYERRYYPLLTQVIVGGVDADSVIYTLDPLGSVLPDDYAAVGTGAEMALGVLDQEFKPKMTEKDAVSLAVKSIKSAIMRDNASGDGIDVLVVDKNGTRESTLN
jgi:proteasome beta subunit